VSRFRKLEDIPSWRLISLHAWRPPRDPSVYGTLELDLSKTLPWLEERRQATGLHLTLTHLIGKAIAMAIAERPEVNAIVRRRRHLYVRDTIDVFFQVAFGGGEDLSGAKVREADTKSVEDMARELQERVERIRAREAEGAADGRDQVQRLPALLRRPALDLAAWLSYDLGLDLRRFGLPYDQFGSVMVTNVGMFGLPVGFAPLVPFARTPLLLTVGSVEKRAVAVGPEQEEVAVHPMLTVGATFDHRVLDGYQAGKLAKRFTAIVEDPQGEL
jgi:pyruvate/2-oxoglutarate dehydrogenase complex dihydrolipoamide acyltransferase (E2) component